MFVHRGRTFAERGLAFEDAEKVFAGVTVQVEDARHVYGERRIICFGRLFSMRKANAREKALIAPYLEV